MKRASLSALLIALTCCACSVIDTARPGAVPAAVLQPVLVSDTRAFAASPENLERKGYVEAEYYVSGTAGRYVFPDSMADAVAVDGGHAYKTRMIVRRPADPARFNGTVVVTVQSGNRD